ncbi:hypothetical protein FHK02_4121 [Spirosoma sp. LMG 31448]|nr:hypothetical protein [Spirosoma utsteinense]
MPYTLSCSNDRDKDDTFAANMLIINTLILIGFSQNSVFGGGSKQGNLGGSG